jgi:O-methyltransferase involved in polyketide biosynthesis
LLARVRAAGEPTLVLSEGLLVYLAPEQVGRLARHLHDEPSMRWWVTDVVTPLLARMVGTFWQPALAGAPFRFAPPTARRSSQRWDGGRRSSARSGRSRSACSARCRWQRGGLSLGQFAHADAPRGDRRMSGVVVLERA